jgi:hypothetical protein
MINKSTFILLLLCFLCSHLKGQASIETDSFKVWQPNLRLSVTDFKQDTNDKTAVKYKEKIGLLAGSCVSVVRYLDVPKKKKKQGKLLEIAYFVPVWSKYQSYTFTGDSMVIEKQKLYFDIAEMICRMARKDIDSLQISTKSYGRLYFAYVGIANHYCSKFSEFHKEYTQAVFVRKEENAFALWRSMTDKKLQELEKYATKPLDCQRVLTKQPVEKEYHLSPTIYGQLKKCN